MKEEWIKAFLSFGLLLGSVWNSNADGWIQFHNSIGGIRPVFQRNGSIVVAPFVAQLYMLKDDWVAVSTPVAFVQNGRFGGKSVVIPGDYGGKAVTFQVRVWDGQRFSSYAEAYQAFSATGESDPFSEILATSPNEPAKPMLNFNSFTLSWDDSGIFTPTTIRGEIVTEEDQSIPFVYPGAYDCGTFPPNVYSITSYSKSPIHPISGYLPGLSLGSLHGVWRQSPFGNYQLEYGPFTYVPNPHTYGTDLIYFEVCTEFSEGPIGSSAIAVSINPSPDRSKPMLILWAQKKPALLGLNARQYRIDRSTDLNTWEPAGAVTGNYSTVDLSSFVTAGASAHFLRATDVTAP